MTDSDSLTPLLDFPYGHIHLMVVSTGDLFFAKIFHQVLQNDSFSKAIIPQYICGLEFLDFLQLLVYSQV